MGHRAVLHLGSVAVTDDILSGSHNTVTLYDLSEQTPNEHVTVVMILRDRTGRNFTLSCTCKAASQPIFSTVSRMWAILDASTAEIDR